MSPEKATVVARTKESLRGIFPEDNMFAVRPSEAGCQLVINRHRFTIGEESLFDLKPDSWDNGEIRFAGDLAAVTDFAKRFRSNSDVIKDKDNHKPASLHELTVRRRPARTLPGIRA